jgi:SSS family solute:Na+ symporter
MVIGFATGLLWYNLSGWGVAQFLYGIHPVWLGMSANIVALVLLSLITSSDGWRLSEGSAVYLGAGLLIVGATIAAYAIQAFAALKPTGLLGLVIFFAALTAAFGSMVLFRPRQEAVSTDSVAAAA